MTSAPETRMDRWFWPVALGITAGAILAVSGGAWWQCLLLAAAAAFIYRIVWRMS